MERLIFEENRQDSVKTTILTANELMERIYMGEQVPQDERFLPTDRGGSFRFFYLKFLVDSHDVFYPIVEENNKIVALSELRNNPYKENNLWFTFISVDPIYQGKGYASKLIENIFTYVKNNKKSLDLFVYSPEGRLKLEHVVKRYIEKTSVEITKEEF